MRALVLPFVALTAVPALAQTESRQTCEESNGERTTIIMKLSKGPIVFLDDGGALVLADCTSLSALEIS
ncbi:MAG: hypothetical protein ABIQ85_12525, partial [Cypionkella sp.]